MPEKIMVAISQPTFLPWLGYFALMDYVDEFVLLDHVAIDKRSWQSRNRIKTAKGAEWVTVPVNATQGQALNTVKISESLEKQAKMIEQTYGHNQHAVKVASMIRGNNGFLSALNTRLIFYFRDALGINTKIQRSSDMGVSGTKSALLADICHRLGAEEYISTPGASDYLDKEAFDCDVAYFKYDHPTYRQRHGEFIPFMSVLDLLCCEGDKSLEIIRAGNHPSA